MQVSAKIGAAPASPIYTGPIFSVGGRQCEERGEWVYTFTLRTHDGVLVEQSMTRHEREELLKMWEVR